MNTERSTSRGKAMYEEQEVDISQADNLQVDVTTVSTEPPPAGAVVSVDDIGVQRISAYLTTVVDPDAETQEPSQQTARRYQAPHDVMFTEGSVPPSMTITYITEGQSIDSSGNTNEYFENLSKPQFFFKRRNETKKIDHSEQTQEQENSSPDPVNTIRTSVKKYLLQNLTKISPNDCKNVLKRKSSLKKNIASINLDTLLSQKKDVKPFARVLNYFRSASETSPEDLFSD